MIEQVKSLVEEAADRHLARCTVREYLQARTLECLVNAGAFANWVFVGGTALRFLYSMPRFSEDLDFSTKGPGVVDNFIGLMEKIKKQFAAEVYDVKVKVKAEKTVKSAFVKFVGLLYELGLSPLSSETISIKVEIDTNPPAGAGLATSIVRRHTLLNVQHYDKASLLAGKLHALLTRKYTKGRDVYDLVWYLSDRSWPQPNIKLLNNALTQTGWEDEMLTAQSWRKLVLQRVVEFDFKSVIADVEPFLERQEEVQMLAKENVIRLLSA